MLHEDRFRDSKLKVFERHSDPWATRRSRFLKGSLAVLSRGLFAAAGLVAGSVISSENGSLTKLMGREWPTSTLVVVTFVFVLFALILEYLKGQIFTRGEVDFESRLDAMVCRVTDPLESFARLLKSPVTSDLREEALEKILSTGSELFGRAKVRLSVYQYQEYEVDSAENEEPLEVLSLVVSKGRNDTARRTIDNMTPHGKELIEATKEDQWHRYDKRKDGTRASVSRNGKTSWSSFLVVGIYDEGEYLGTLHMDTTDLVTFDRTDYECLRYLAKLVAGAMGRIDEDPSRIPETFAETAKIVRQMQRVRA
jgi:hypothetical protein